MIRSDTSPVAFLFKAKSAPCDSNYATYFRDELLKALNFTNAQDIINSRILHGDFALQLIPYRISAVSKDGRMHKMSGDYNQYATLIGDFLDASAAQTSSMNYEVLAETIGHEEIYCIFIPSMVERLRSFIDSELKNLSGYLSSIVIDLGNPLQHTLFVRFLFDDLFLKNGIMYSYQDETLEIGSVGDLTGTTILNHHDFLRLRPNFPAPSELTSRGEASLNRWKGKAASTVHERIAKGLLANKVCSPFDWDLAAMPNGPFEVEIATDKLLKYLLNPLHKVGKAKAGFFSKELNINEDDWEYLKIQIATGMERAKFDKIYSTEHGIKAEAEIGIMGLNGRAAVIQTVWIVRKNERASLVTAQPGLITHPDKENAINSPIVDKHLVGKARWERIYDLASEAGEIAAEKAIPTPMRVKGYPILMEGACGFGHVWIPNARSGFGRWLLKVGHSLRSKGGGARLVFLSPTQSIERAGAAAQAFADVLRMNGIECSNYTVLD
ncbi:DUF6883 domain-containing protein [Pseudochelatococcus sp. G4_1912]|uniref:DUF6883 domain-containing protein n=1 Tax=Pseudochelatococcus sp. G4_1912 TaxID=3114288 RepID=UPI0039C6AD6E